MLRFFLLSAYCSFAIWGHSSGSVEFKGPETVLSGQTYDYQFIFLPPSPRYATLEVVGGTFIEPYRSHTVIVGGGETSMKIKWGNSLGQGRVIITSLINNPRDNGGVGPDTTFAACIVELHQPKIDVVTGERRFCANSNYVFDANAQGWQKYQWKVNNDGEKSFGTTTSGFYGVTTKSTVRNVSCEVRAYHPAIGWSSWSKIGVRGDRTLPPALNIVELQPDDAAHLVSLGVNAQDENISWDLKTESESGAKVVGNRSGEVLVVNVKDMSTPSWAVASYSTCNRVRRSYYLLDVDEQEPEGNELAEVVTGAQVTTENLASESQRLGDHVIHSGELLGLSLKGVLSVESISFSGSNTSLQYQEQDQMTFVDTSSLPQGSFVLVLDTDSGPKKLRFMIH